MVDEEKLEMMKQMLGVRSIGIRAIPEKTYKRFSELANTDFCGHYGLTLKFLIDFYDGAVPMGNEHLELQINSIIDEFEKLSARVDTMEKKNETDNKKEVGRKMMDGSVI